MTANLHVMRTAGRSGPLQPGANLTVMRRRCGPDRQHIEARREIFDCDQVVGPARRLLRAIVQLAERNAGNAELFGQRVELLAQR